MGSAYNMAAACTAWEQVEKEEKKACYKALTVAVKDYPNVCPASELPMRSLTD
jgi:hypothetical protein